MGVSDTFKLLAVTHLLQQLGLLLTPKIGCVVALTHAEEGGWLSDALAIKSTAHPSLLLR